MSRKTSLAANIPGATVATVVIIGALMFAGLALKDAAIVAGIMIVLVLAVGR